VQDFETIHSSFLKVGDDNKASPSSKRLPEQGQFRLPTGLAHRQCSRPDQNGDFTNVENQHFDEE